MAGAGYKLFTTGSVLTAAEVNTYLQEQAVMRFATVAARTAALSGVLAEGMVSYIDATDTLEVYNGSAWISAIGDITEVQGSTGISVASGTGPVPVITNSMATAIDAKGDLVAGTGADAFARLAVGNNGETLVADSSATTGLRYTSLFGANKNAILNADFRINQRNFSSTVTNSVYGFDRWRLITNQTVTYSAQTFTAGTAPVAGYEGINFARMASTAGAGAGDYAILSQPIEDVRTLSGQTVTVSFWAKAASGTPKLGVELWQNFGQTGSPSAATGAAGQSVTLNTSWTRYSVTIANPSVSGKTITTSSFTEMNFWVSAGSTFNSRSGSVGNQTATIDIWGVQLEAGSVATAFQTATGTLAGELAACQRYYWRTTAKSAYFYSGFSYDSTIFFSQVVFPVIMRTDTPTLQTTGTAGDYRVLQGGTFINSSAVPTLETSLNSVATVRYTASSGYTQGWGGAGSGITANAYLAFSAEL